MSTSVTISQGTGIYHLPLQFKLQHGGELRGAQLAFELNGPQDAPLVVVHGGISAGRHVSSNEFDPQRGWWESFVGPGLAIDTDQYRVLGVDYLGGQGASTGPSNWRSTEPIPAISSKDQARALVCLLDHLQEPAVHSFIGSSYGGMVGLALAAEFPERLQRLVCISAAHQSHPMATAWRSIQRQTVRLAQAHGDIAQGMGLARGLAMASYRSYDEFGQRFSQEPRFEDGIARFEVEDYLTARGVDFAKKFDPEVFLLLSQAIDLHLIDPKQVKVATTVVSVPTDQLVPLQQAQELVAALGPYGNLQVLPSLFGHDAFLKEVQALTPILQDSLSTTL